MARPRVTHRCETDDLPSLPLGVAEALLRKFESMRGHDPEAGELIAGLVQRRCLSLHSGRYRAATWYDREREIVWLVAAGVHRQDSPNDIYAIAQRLESGGSLYPDNFDYDWLDAHEQVEMWESEARDLRRLRDSALQTPGADRIEYRSKGGLYAEIWTESVPELLLLCLRLRLTRLTDTHLGDEELAVVLRGALSSEHEEKPDPDGHHLFRYFEEYVEDEGRGG